MGRQKKPKITVALVDGQPVVRAGVEVSLKRDSRLTVVGSGANMEDAALAISARSPDVFVIDVGSVPNAIRDIHIGYPHAKIVVFASADSAALVREAAREGIDGYLLKSSSTEELIRAIKTVHAGGVHFSPQATRALVSDYARESDRTHVLTPRERQVLKLIAEGRTSRDIALMLQVSVRTVDSHRKHISQKLGIRSVAGLTRFAFSQGITESD